jgi:hypothetical protein
MLDRFGHVQQGSLPAQGHEPAISSGVIPLTMRNAAGAAEFTSSLALFPSG